MTLPVNVKCVWNQSVNFLIKKKTFVIIKSKFCHAPQHPLVCVSCQTHETLNKVSVLERLFKKCFFNGAYKQGAKYAVFEEISSVLWIIDEKSTSGIRK